jgi:NTE family protein
MMLGGYLENTTSRDFRIAATARYLGFDQLGSGSELRIDGTIGSDPGAGIELYRPVGPTPLFIAPYAGVQTRTFDLVARNVILARYRQHFPRAGLNVGVNFGARSDLRVGAYVQHTSASIETGSPGFPEIEGKETGAELVWRVDTQDLSVVPTTGVRSQVRLWHVFDGPDLVRGEPSRYDIAPTQLSGTANQFWSLSPASRVFVYGGLGTSFDSTPLPPDQFALGVPFALGAYDTGELRGAHYYVATAGYLRRVGRLPDFVGGPVYAGAWLENGDAFDSWRLAMWRTNGGAGLVIDTLVGPLVVAGSWSFDGRWRTYVAVGRTFR